MYVCSSICSVGACGNVFYFSIIFSFGKKKKQIPEKRQKREEKKKDDNNNEALYDQRCKKIPSLECVLQYSTVRSSHFCLFFASPQRCVFSPSVSLSDPTSHTPGRRGRSGSVFANFGGGGDWARGNNGKGDKGGSNANSASGANTPDGVRSPPRRWIKRSGSVGPRPRNIAKGVGLDNTVVESLNNASSKADQYLGKRLV